MRSSSERMQSSRSADSQSLIKLVLGRQDVERLVGGYPIVGDKRLSGQGELVYLFRSLSSIDSVAAEYAPHRIDVIIPSNWKQRDIEKMSGRYYQVRMKSGLIVGDNVHVTIDMSNNSIRS